MSDLQLWHISNFQKAHTQKCFSLPAQKADWESQRSFNKISISCLAVYRTPFSLITESAAASGTHTVHKDKRRCRKAIKEDFFLLIPSSSHQPLVGKVDLLWVLAARFGDSEASFGPLSGGVGGGQGQCPLFAAFVRASMPETSCCCCWLKIFGLLFTQSPQKTPKAPFV